MLGWRPLYNIFPTVGVLYKRNIKINIDPPCVISKSHDESAIVLSTFFSLCPVAKAVWLPVLSIREESWKTVESTTDIIIMLYGDAHVVSWRKFQILCSLLCMLLNLFDSKEIHAGSEEKLLRLKM